MQISLERCLPLHLRSPDRQGKDHINTSGCYIILQDLQCFVPRFQRLNFKDLPWDNTLSQVDAVSISISNFTCEVSNQLVQESTCDFSLNHTTEKIAGTLHSRGGHNVQAKFETDLSSLFMIHNSCIQ